MVSTLDNVRARLITENKSLSPSAKGQKQGTKGWTRQPQFEWPVRQSKRQKAGGPFSEKDLGPLQKEPVPY